MNIASLGITAPMPAQLPTGTRSSDAAAQFDAMFYRLLLQTAHSMPGMAGGNKAEQALFGGMITDFFAQEAARQQSAFGAMLLTIDGQEKGKA